MFHIDSREFRTRKLPYYPHCGVMNGLHLFHKALAPGGYLATENTQKLPQEVSHLFQQVVPDAQLFKKIGE